MYTNTPPEQLHHICDKIAYSHGFDYENKMIIWMKDFREIIFDQDFMDKYIDYTWIDYKKYSEMILPRVDWAINILYEFIQTKIANRNLKQNLQL